MSAKFHNSLPGRKYRRQPPPCQARISPVALSTNARCQSIALWCTPAVCVGSGFLRFYHGTEQLLGWGVGVVFFAG